MKRNNEINNTIKISVRHLVEFILRSGDIDTRHGAGADIKAMQAGSRIHRKIQRGMGADYQAEMALKYEGDIPETEGDIPYKLVIEGRADGVIIKEDCMTVDEIKGIYQDVNILDNPQEVHLAQAMCYACMLIQEREYNQIYVQMTYVNLETEEIRRFKEAFTAEYLMNWFERLIDEFSRWARYRIKRRKQRRSSCEGLEFPYPYREGQRDLAVGVYRTIQREKTLFLQAATGIGKTLSVLFPAVRAIGEGMGDKLFYLTAKTITRTAAEDALRILKTSGLDFQTVTLTAKEKLCFMEECKCNPDNCPYARGHYDRINQALYELLNKTGMITRDDILESAEEYQVCPFELSLDATDWADGIICDYNYAFDPNVKLKRYFAEGVKGEYIFLVDEAHNLIERARSMYSASLYKDDFLKVRKVIKNTDKKVLKGINRINRLMLELKKECTDYCIRENISQFSSSLSELFTEIEKLFEKNPGVEMPEDFMQLYFDIRHFLNMFEQMNDGYLIYTQLLPDDRFMLKLFCVDPAGRLKQCLEAALSTVFFSATLLPVHYYRRLLHASDPEDYAIYAKSPFDTEKCLLLIADDVTSKYTRRSRSEYERIAAYIKQMAMVRYGNYLVFFPSYVYLKAVTEVLLEDEAIVNDKIRLLPQKPSMNEQMREDYLNTFESRGYHEKQSLVGLCVMGGIFSEGIDLQGERLIGAAIVGTGLPMVSAEQDILKGYFEKNGQDPFDFAYRYPGMNKVLQAAGRVIRTMEDRGVVMLLDERFLKPGYRELFPREWAHYKQVSVHTVEDELNRFWK